MKQNLSPRANRNESNIIIDGGMELWPESTSRSIANNTSAYGSVLFQYNNISSGVTITNSRQASVPAGTNIPFSNQVSKTAAGALAFGTRQIMHYHVEGYDIQSLINKEFSVIFWVKSSVASNRSMSIRNATSTHSYVQQYNIAAANTWELKVLRVAPLSSCPGTLDRTNGAGIIIGWDIVTGSTFQTSTLGSWVAGNFSSGIGEDTTWLTGTTHDFSIAGVMVLPGDWTALTASGYSLNRAGRNFQDEVSMTQRYFEKSYDTDVTPGTVTNIGMVGYSHGAGSNNNPSYFTAYFRQSKRAIPTVVAYSNLTATVNQINDGGTDRAATYEAIGRNAATIGTSTVNIRAAIRFHFTADARF